MRRKLVCAGILLALSAFAPAATYLYTSALNGFQEVPATNSQGIGIIQLELDDSDLSASGSGAVFFLSGSATDFHIHNAPFGSNGPIVLNIGAGAISGNSVAFDITLPDQASFDSLKALLDADQGYFNIHTPNFPTGEIRGQIAPVLVPEPAALVALGLGALGLLKRRRKT